MGTSKLFLPLKLNLTVSEEFAGTSHSIFPLVKENESIYLAYNSA